MDSIWCYFSCMDSFYIPVRDFAYLCIVGWDLEFNIINSFQALGLQGFHWIMSCMIVCDWHVIKNINLLCILMFIEPIVELHCLELNQKVPFNQAEIFVNSMGAYIPYFNTWIRKFHQNYKVFIDVLGWPTLIFMIEARDLPCLFMYFRKIWTLLDFF